MENSRTDMTAYSLESSTDGVELRFSKRASKGDHPDATLVATGGIADGSEAGGIDSLPYFGIKTPNDEELKKARTLFIVYLVQDIHHNDIKILQRVIGG